MPLDVRYQATSGESFNSSRTLDTGALLGDMSTTCNVPCTNRKHHHFYAIHDLDEARANPTIASLLRLERTHTERQRRLSDAGMFEESKAETAAAVRVRE